MRIPALLLLVFTLSAPVYAQDEQTENKFSYVKFGTSYMVEGDEDIRGDAAGWTVDFENNFQKNHFLISSVSFGYRRENSHERATGHFVNLKVGRDFNVKYFDLGIKGGVEWGRPSTKFTFSEEVSSGYRYVSLDYNSNIPYLKPNGSATLYPVAEVSLSRPWRRFLVEGGVRANVFNFRVEEYRLSGDRVDSTTKRTFRVIPSVFFNIGFGI